MPEAVGSTFPDMGLGGIVVLLAYVILGPGAVIFHVARWLFHRRRLATHHQALFGYNDLQTIRQCLPWNIAITLIPAIPYVIDLFRH